MLNNTLLKMKNREKSKRYYQRKKDEIKAKKQAIYSLGKGLVSDAPQQPSTCPAPDNLLGEMRAAVQYTKKQTDYNDILRTMYLFEDDTLTENNPISEAQIKIANDVIEAFQNPETVFVMVIAPTQSGKTGAFRHTFRQFVEQGVPVDNLFCVTGKSDVSLKSQTQQRLPNILKNHVYHGPDLKKQFVKEMEGKSDCVMIVDECHCACGEKNSLAKALKMMGLMDKAELYRRNIRVILVSATPCGTLYNLHRWKKDTYRIIDGKPGPTYIGCIDLLGMGRVFEAEDLLKPENVIKLGEKIVNYDVNGNDPLYHIIRAYTGYRYQKVRDSFKNVFGNLINYIEHLQDSEDINNILSVRPNKHTIIFVKEKLRCGKSLVKTSLGVLYDRPTNFTDDSVVIQGLVGRACGYDDNGKTIIYCHIQSLINYVPIVENKDFSQDYTGWVSSSTEVIGNRIHGKQTFTDPSHYKGTGVLPRPVKKREPKPEALTVHVKTFEELKDCYKVFNVGTSRKGPNAIKKTPGGFVLGTIRNCNNRVLSLNQVLHEKNNAVSDAKPCGHKPCYTDVNNPSTLLFVFIHRNPAFSFPSSVAV